MRSGACLVFACVYLPELDYWGQLLISIKKAAPNRPKEYIAPVDHFASPRRGLVFSNPLTTSATFNAWAGPPPAELLQEMWTAPAVPAKGVQVPGSSHWGIIWYRTHGVPMDPQNGVEWVGMGWLIFIDVP